MPLSIDWTARRISCSIVEGRARRLMRQTRAGRGARGGTLTSASFGEAPFNEIVVDATGNAYVNGGPGCVVLIRLTAQSYRSPTAFNGRTGWS